MAAMIEEPPGGGIMSTSSSEKDKASGKSYAALL